MRWRSGAGSQGEMHRQLTRHGEAKFFWDWEENSKMAIKNNGRGERFARQNPTVNQTSGSLALDGGRCTGKCKKKRL